MTAAMVALAAAFGAGVDPGDASANRRCATIEIYRDAHGGWRWIERSDAPTCQSHGPFATASEAAADAESAKSLCDRLIIVEGPSE